MTAFENAVDANGFALKVWRGESMCLCGMDVPSPEPDFVGFSIEVKAPGAPDFTPLRNRLAFSYPAGTTVNGDKQFLSTEAPFQKFRWVHFPQNPITCRRRKTSWSPARLTRSASRSIR
jgi:hypothetical protein